MQRRAYLAALGTAGLAATAGCSNMSNAVQDDGASTNFVFPPGWDANGVAKPDVAFRYHNNALDGQAFTATFETGGSTQWSGTVRSAGTADRRRWLIDRERTTYTDLYREPGITYAGRDEDDGDRPSTLTVSADERAPNRVEDALGDAVGPPFKRALNLPYGTGTFEVRDDEEPAVAVFTVEEMPRDVNWVSLERLRIAVDEAGAVRTIDARYTPDTAAADPDQTTFSYDLTRGETPPADRIARPDELTEFPTFAVEWQHGGRVMAVTNTGGRPVVAENGFLEIPGPGRINLRPIEALEPGATGYVTDAGGELRMTAAPPDDAGSRPVIRREEPPWFQYYYDSEYEHGGPYEVLYSTACDGLDC